jgi:glycerate kinase
LERLAELVPPVDGEPLPPIEVLCDVDNPLTGRLGAARVFGPQKGASPAALQRLEAGLERLGELAAQRHGHDVRQLPGAGAAGGLAGGAAALFGAQLVPGVDRVMEAIGLAQAVRGADWVLSGEGKLDEPSLSGKVVSGVARTAHAAGGRLAVIAGSIELGAEQLINAGIAAVESCRPDGMPLAAALDQAEALLEDAARRFARRHLGGG